MTEQITVPRATWDAMREALERIAGTEIFAFQRRDIANSALTAANAVSHPKPETAPVTEGGAITSESGNAVSAPVGINGLTEAETSASMSVMGLSKPTVQPQAQGESYSERWYGSGEDRGWWIVRGGLVKREHVAFLGESVSPEEVSKVVAELNAAHPQATEPAPKNLIGWRTADYLRETTDRHTARNWEVHYEVLPIFEGDANTKLAAAPEAKQ